MESFLKSIEKMFNEDQRSELKYLFILGIKVTIIPKLWACNLTPKVKFQDDSIFLCCLVQKSSWPHLFPIKLPTLGVWNSRGQRVKCKWMSVKFRERGRKQQNDIASSSDGGKPRASALFATVILWETLQLTFYFLKTWIVTFAILESF